MEKGMAIIEVTDTGYNGIHIEQEVLEFARLNALVKKRVAVAEARKRNAEREYRRAEKAVARRRACNLRSFAYVFSRLAVFGGVAWAGMVGMIHPAIYIPVALLCLSAACLRLGAWFGMRWK